MRWSLPCGALRIEIAAPPVLTAACHCRGCQRMSASAFSLTAMVPADAFKVLEGEPVKGGIHGPTLDHYCCATCKSWVFTRIAGFDAFVNVRPTMFDYPRWSRPFIETMTRDKLPWVTTPAEFRYKTFPDIEDLRTLMDAFAATL